LFYVVPIILLPYILNPASHASWLLVKGYYPLTHFFYCAVLLFNYFGKVRQWRRWLSSGIAASVLVSIAAALLLAVSLMPECKINEAWEHTLNSIIIAVGLLMTIYCGVAIWQVWQWIHEYSTDNFSNIDDFPLPYARGVIVIPIIHALLIWPMVLLDSPKWLAIMQLLLAVFNIFFLISALPSKRKGNPLEQMIEDNREADNEEVLEQTLPTEEHPEIIEQRPKERQMDIPEQTRQKIADGIEKALVRQRLYLNPNLRLKEVVDVCGYSQAYVSRVLREQYGGFFDYVNILRCRHVDEYIARHPEVTKEEAIIKSGFKDRQNYYRIKKHLFQNDSQED
jgi:AraC-like DNA-binding protein